MPPRRRRPSSPPPAAGQVISMPVLDDESYGAAAAAADYTDDCSDDRRRQRCSCLPFCFWGASGGPIPKPDNGAQVKRRRRRRLRLRLSWLAWPWFRKQRGADSGAGGEGTKGNKKQRTRGRRLLLLLTTSLQPKKALASVVSGDSALLPVPAAAKVSSFGDAKKRSNRKPRRRPAGDDASSGGGGRQPQASAAAATTSAGWSTAPARCSRPETSPRPMTDDGPAAGGRIWRAPSRRHRSLLHQPDSASCGGGAGLWTAATTLGVIVFLGRVTAVVFLCSCLYGARFVRARAASARAAKNSGTAGGSSSSRRFGGDTVGVAAEKVVAELCATEECKKKVVMAGLLDRDGKRHTRADVTL